MSEPPGGPPVLRVVRGDPTPEEIAALGTVLVAYAAAPAATAPARRTGTRWADRASLLRRPVFAGPGAWRASAVRR